MCASLFFCLDQKGAFYPFPVLLNSALLSNWPHFLSFASIFRFFIGSRLVGMVVYCAFFFPPFVANSSLFPIDVCGKSEERQMEKRNSENVSKAGKL